MYHKTTLKSFIPLARACRSGSDESETRPFGAQTPDSLILASSQQALSCASDGCDQETTTISHRLQRCCVSQFSVINPTQTSRTSRLLIGGVGLWLPNQSANSMRLILCQISVCHTQHHQKCKTASSLNLRSKWRHCQQFATRVELVFILARPRIVCISNPKLRSNLLLTRSTLVRILYNRFHL